MWIPFNIIQYHKKILMMNLCAVREASSVDAFGGATTLLKCLNIIPPVLRIYRTVRITNAMNWSAAFRTYVRKTAPSNVSRVYFFVDRISAVKPAVLKCHNTVARGITFITLILWKNKWIANYLQFKHDKREKKKIFF